MNKTRQVLMRIEERAAKDSLHIVGKEKAGLLETLVRKHKPKVALETGTLVGYSAILIAGNMPKDGRLISIEIDKARTETAKRNIAEAGLSGKISVVIGEAASLMGGFKGRFGFVFFDVADYLQCLRTLEQNGCIGAGSVIVANNIKWFGEKLQPYLGHVRNSGKYKSVCYDFGFDGMEVSIKK